MKILIVDDHRIFREGLKSLFATQPNMEVVGEAMTGKEAIEKTRSHKPDIIIMDVSMPDMNGITATSSIMREFPNTKIIVLSMHSDHYIIKEMLKAGALAYLLKDCALNELLNAVDAVANNNTYFCKPVTELIINDVMDDKQNQKKEISLLSLREKEVLRLLVNGFTIKEIAESLNLSHKTIEAHKRNLMDKLDIYNLPELTKFAIQKGLTSLNI